MEKTSEGAPTEAPNPLSSFLRENKKEMAEGTSICVTFVDRVREGNNTKRASSIAWVGFRDKGTGKIVWGDSVTLSAWMHAHVCVPEIGTVN